MSSSHITYRCVVDANMFMVAFHCLNNPFITPIQTLYPQVPTPWHHTVPLEAQPHITGPQIRVWIHLQSHISFQRRDTTHHHFKTPIVRIRQSTGSQIAGVVLLQRKCSPSSRDPMLQIAYGYFHWYPVLRNPRQLTINPELKPLCSTLRFLQEVTP